MTAQETYLARLRRHRQRCRITLEEIAAHTRIKIELLEAFERNDLSTWPNGLFARAYVRSYAAHIGMDADDTVDEFCRLFQQGNRRAQRTMQQMAAIVAAPAEWRDEFDHPVDRRKIPAINVLAKPPRLEAALSRVSYAFRAFWTRATRTSG